MLLRKTEKSKTGEWLIKTFNNKGIQTKSKAGRKPQKNSLFVLASRIKKYSQKNYSLTDNLRKYSPFACTDFCRDKEFACDVPDE